MRPTERGAGGEVALAGAAEDRERKAIIPPMPDLGNCANCGAHVRLIGGTTTCPTCAAWHRWYSAHRIASQALRGVTR